MSTMRKAEDDSVTVEELQARSASLAENISALRFSLMRIESLDALRLKLREMLADCRVPLEAHGLTLLVRRIDVILAESLG